MRWSNYIALIHIMVIHAHYEARVLTLEPYSQMSEDLEDEANDRDLVERCRLPNDPGQRELQSGQY